MKKLFENWRRFTEDKKPNYGYIIGNLQGEVYAAENEDQLFYGASMNKPLVALANLIMYKDQPDKQLDAKELKGLLTYTGYDSNDINRILAGRNPRKPCLVGKNCCGDPGRPNCTKAEKKREEPSRTRSSKTYNYKMKIYNKLLKRKKRIGRITPEMAHEFLVQYGLDENMLIIYGGKAKNQQSARSFFQFLNFLHDLDRISGIEKEVDIIINHMKREPIGLARTDRESKKWKTLVDKLNQEGLMISSIYGKGGKTKDALNYGFVINDNIVLSIYTDKDDRKFLTDKIVDILRSSGAL